MKPPRVDVNVDNYAALKKAAAEKGMSVRSLVNSIIEKVGIADKEEKVILSVPMDLTKNNKEGLRNWLKAKVDVVVGLYYPE